MYCPNCGNPIQEGQKFCAACGAALNRSQTSDSSPDSQPQPEVQPQFAGEQPLSQQAVDEPAKPKRLRWPLVVGIVAGVCALVAVVVFVVLPLVLPHGVWALTKTETRGEWDDGESYDNVDTFTNDEYGRPVSASSVYSTSWTDDDSVSTYTFEFDNEGHCVYKELEDEDGVTDATYTWDTDESGKTVASTSVDDSGEEVNTSYEYNSQGYIVKKTARYDDGREYVTEFDDDGYIMRTIYEQGDYTEECTYTYEYDSNHRPISCTQVTKDRGTDEVSNEVIRTFEYDENGSLVHETHDSTYYYADETTQTCKAESTYEYEYVENPLPWVVQTYHMNFGTMNLF